MAFLCRGIGRRLRRHVYDRKQCPVRKCIGQQSTDPTKTVAVCGVPYPAASYLPSLRFIAVALLHCTTVYYRELCRCAEKSAQSMSANHSRHGGDSTECGAISAESDGVVSAAEGAGGASGAFERDIQLRVLYCIIQTAQKPPIRPLNHEHRVYTAHISFLCHVFRSSLAAEGHKRVNRYKYNSCHTPNVRGTLRRYLRIRKALGSRRVTCTRSLYVVKRDCSGT